MSIKDLLEHQESIPVLQRTARPLPQPRFTRIDFHQVNLGADEGMIRWGYRVEKYIEGWEHAPGVAAYDVTFNPRIQTPTGTISFDLDKALHILEANGWIVRRWWSGARAWRGEIHPVRTRHEIHTVRRRIEKQIRSGLATQGAHTSLDFAFDM
jgi:hypothetical protein